MSSPNDWFEFYQQNPSDQSQLPDPNMFNTSVTDATLATTTATTTSSGTPSPSNLIPEGRVSKPARRRSRASRRTPTTLLSTDPTNFRAMVQQFTGGPSSAYGSSGSTNIGAQNIDFAMLGARYPANVNHPRGSILGGLGYNLPFHQQQQEEASQQFMFSLHNPSARPPGNNVLPQRVSDVQFMEDSSSVSSQFPASTRPSSSSSENRSFMF